VVQEEKAMDQEMLEILSAANEWNETRAKWHREWLHDLAIEMAAAFEAV
jgi:hypothetical protein